LSSHKLILLLILSLLLYPENRIKDFEKLHLTSNALSGFIKKIFDNVNSFSGLSGFRDIILRIIIFVKTSRKYSFFKKIKIWLTN